NGAQICPPIDEAIARSIGENQELGPHSWDIDGVESDPNVEDVTQRMMDAYFEAAAGSLASAGDREANSCTALRYVYTPMHGVGAPFAARMLTAFGLPPFVPVPEQMSPDPDFPTVAFPNPEEKGALDMAKGVADAQGVGLVLANDPDADRFAAAEKQPDGSWFVFTGDQLGTIFAAAVLAKARAAGIPDERIAMVNSTVSSRMLAVMAKAEGFRYADTLTGFKWMANELIALQRQGLFVGFGYEEAIGYMIHDHVLDKDGITALAVFVQLAAQLHAEKKSVVGFLEEQYARYGYFVSANSYFVCPDPVVTSRIFTRIRYGSSFYVDDDGDDEGVERFEFVRDWQGDTLQYPRTIGGFPVSYIRDLTTGFEMHDVDSLSATAATAEAPLRIARDECLPVFPVSGSSHMVTFETRNGGRLTMRTSGTEPKLKYYLEVRNQDNDRGAAARDLETMVNAVANELVRATVNGL
ncbi:hypothetical protein GGI21_001954, partial [Coemansia aciculifera]